MADLEFWRQEEVLKIQHWLKDLRESGYAEPEIINRDTTLNQSELCGSTQYKNISKVG